MTGVVYGVAERSEIDEFPEELLREHGYVYWQQSRCLSGLDDRWETFIDEWIQMNNAFVIREAEPEWTIREYCDEIGDL